MIVEYREIKPSKIPPVWSVSYKPEKTKEPKPKPVRTDKGKAYADSWRD